MLRVLHLEDDPLDTGLLQEFMREAGLEVELHPVDNLNAFTDQLQQGGYDLIISDFTLPGADPMVALDQARSLRPGVPFLFVSGTIPEDQAIEALKRGASDYVFKQRLGRLVPAVHRALKEAEDQARRHQAEAVLRAVTDGVEDAIFVKDARGCYLMANAAACRRLGRASAEEVLQQQDEAFFPAEIAARIRVRDQEVMRTGQRQRYEESLVMDGSRRVFLTSKAPYHAPDGSIVGVLGISHDITERKRAEEEIRRLNETLEQRVEQRTRELHEANANLQAFTGTAAHDLRAPLRAIGSLSAVTLEDYGAQLDLTGRSYLERIQGSAQHMNRLLSDLLEYSRVTQAELKLEPVELRRAVDEALGLLQADIRSAGAILHAEGDFPIVVAHSATLVMVLTNLVANALKFVAPGTTPRVRIWAEPTAGPKGEAGAGKCGVGSAKGDGGNCEEPAPEPHPALRTPHPAFVRLWVADNGIGISAKDQSKLFTVFQRLQGKQSYPGTGLGLALVRRGTERMGGRVGVESEPGHGSRFWVELPHAE